MKTYYIGNIPFNGEDSISHGRTKGSRNGYSTTPGYVPIGQKARTDDPNLRVDAVRKKKSLWSTVSGAASSAARTVGKTASKAYGSASKAAKSAYSSGKEFITGGNARKNYKTTLSNNRARVNVANDYRNAWRKNYAESRRAQERIGREYRLAQLHDPKDAQAGKQARKLLNDYNEINSMLKADKETMKWTERNAILTEAKAAADEMRARKKYEKTLPGKIEKATKKLKNVGGKKMSEVNNWLSGAANSVSDTANSAYKKAKGAANSAYKTASGAAKKASIAVSSAANSAYKTASGAAKKAYSSVSKTLKTSGSKAISSIKTGASSTAGKVKNFLSGIFGKKKK